MTYTYLENLYDEHGEPNGPAVEFLYRLIQLRSTEPLVNISHHEVPTWDEHCTFVRSKPYRFWEIVFEGDPPKRMAGYVSATQRNELGIVLMPWARGKGVGTAALKDFMRRHHPLPPERGARNGHWLANINPANEPSIRLFAKLRARHIQNTYELP